VDVTVDQTGQNDSVGNPEDLSLPDSRRRKKFGANGSDPIVQDEDIGDSTILRIEHMPARKQHPTHGDTPVRQFDGSTVRQYLEPPNSRTAEPSSVSRT
jgi:hypothetical protein